MRSLRGPPKPSNPSRTLYISKIPPNQNSIPSLVFFFKKYGHLESIWAEGTNAVVTFDSNESAMAAYQDPDPFLNNRFISIVFHKSPRKSEANLDHFVNHATVSRRVSDVQHQIEAKLREQDAFREELRAQTAQRIQEQRIAAQQKMETIEQLKKRRSGYVLAASRLVTGPGNVADTETKETLQGLRQLIDETQKLIEDLQAGRLARRHP
jgi:hypothetical protein